jgi:hypothetical protein
MTEFSRGKCSIWVADWLTYQPIIHTTNQPTNYMEPCLSSEVSSHSATQQVLKILWNPNFITCSQELASGLYSEPDESTLSYSTIHFNIILPSTSSSSQWAFPSGFPNTTLYALHVLFHTCYMPCPSHDMVHDNDNSLVYICDLWNSFNEEHPSDDGL